MSSEVLITESTNLKSVGSTKFYKKGDTSSFNSFVSDLNKEQEPKAHFKKQDPKQKDLEPTRPREDSDKAEGSLVTKNKDDTQHSHKSSSDKDSQNLSAVEKQSPKITEEVVVSEEIEVTEVASVPIPEVVAVPIPVIITPEGLIDDVILESDFQKIQSIRDLQAAPEQDNAASSEILSFDLSLVALKDKTLEVDEFALKGLQKKVTDQQNITNLSNSSDKLVQTEKEVIVIAKASELNFVSTDLDKDKDLLLKSLESNSKEPSLLTQAKVVGTTDTQKQLAPALDAPLDNELSSGAKLADIGELAVNINSNSRKTESKDIPIVKKEVVKITGNKIAEATKLADSELLDNISFDELEISDFAIIDSSKNKPEISFDDSILTSTNKVNIKPQEQLSLSLKYAVSQGKSEITINLYPKALGSIDVKIEFATNSSGQSEVQKVIITAERSSTLKILESTKSHLETALAELKKEAATTVTDTSKKEASLQFDMRDGNNGQPNEGYFGSFNERENWMNKFRNLTTSDDNSGIKSQEGDSVSKRKNIHNSTTIDIEV
jgi:Flagellar hook-length control protein FliK